MTGSRPDGTAGAARMRIETHIDIHDIRALTATPRTPSEVQQTHLGPVARIEKP